MAWMMAEGSGGKEKKKGTREGEGALTSTKGSSGRSTPEAGSRPLGCCKDAYSGGSKADTVLSEWIPGIKTAKLETSP